MQNWVVGVDLGGTKIELGLVDPNDRIVAHRRIATNAQEGGQAVVERMAQSVAELAQALPAGARIAALGICSPGPVDHVTGMLIDPPNIQGLHHTPLRQMLSDRLQMPVALEHDAKAAALGDYHFGAGRGSHSMVYVVVGTGVGAAIIMDGTLYRGEHNSSGEIGHTTLDLDGDLCHCGGRGCAETYMSGPCLVRHYLRACGVDPDQPLPADLAGVTGEQVAKLAAQGDAAASAVMSRAGQALGAAVATMAMLLDIDLYVIGGSVAKAGDLLLAPARAAAPHYAFKSVGARIRIVPTALGDDGPILGCAWLARGA